MLGARGSALSEIEEEMGLLKQGSLYLLSVQMQAKDKLGRPLVARTMNGG